MSIYEYLASNVVKVTGQRVGKYYEVTTTIGGEEIEYFYAKSYKEVRKHRSKWVRKVSKDLRKAVQIEEARK
jgi:hypothetical protein